MTEFPGSDFDVAAMQDALPHFECETYNDSEQPAELVDPLHSREAAAASRESLQVQNRGTKSPAQQGALFRSQEIFALSVIAKLRAAKRSDLLTGLEDCHTKVTNTVCSGCRKINRFYNRCDLFYCPRCQPRLARERSDSVAFWTSSIRQPKHVVLTTRNTRDLTKAHVKCLVRWFAKLRSNVFGRKVTFWEVAPDGSIIRRLKRRPLPADTRLWVQSSPWRGGFYRLEVTNEGKGWHLHLHALVDSDFIHAGVLSWLWNQINGGFGHIVKVKDVRESEYLHEVTKYAVKGNMLAEWTGKQIAEFCDAFKGQRSFGVFGSLWGKRAEWKLFLAAQAGQRAVCACGCSDFHVYSDAGLEWLQETAGGRAPPQKTAASRPFQLELGVIIRDAWNLVGG